MTSNPYQPLTNRHILRLPTNLLPLSYQPTGADTDIDVPNIPQESEPFLWEQYVDEAGLSLRYGNASPVRNGILSRTAIPLLEYRKRSARRCLLVKLRYVICNFADCFRGRGEFDIAIGAWGMFAIFSVAAQCQKRK